MPRFATLDIGTNTVLLLVAESTPEGGFKPVVERAEITRLGRGVDRTGELAPEAIDETVAAVVAFANEARKLGAHQIACVATSASRDARNGPQFLARLGRDAGIRAEIITGHLEAQLSYASAARELGTEQPLIVLDIGGGSTELVYGEGGKVSFTKSYDLGSVRLTERHVRSDPPSLEERREIERVLDLAFQELPRAPKSFRLVGIAGTVTTVCAVSRAVEPYDAEKVHLARMSLQEVRGEVDRFFKLPLAERRALKGIQPKRADVIAAGSLILERVMARLGASEVIVSDRGIRWGLLYHRFGGQAGDR